MFGNQSNTTTSKSASHFRHQSADDRVNYLLSDYDRVTKSLESANRQLRMHRLAYFASIAIMLLDSWFSYEVLYNASESQQMALGLTLLIAATQWQVNTAIFNRRIGTFLTPDRNGDGNVSMQEWGRWGFIITIVVSVYVLNVGTNMIGVNAIGLGSLAWRVPGVPDANWIAAACAFFFATLLCFGDELINVLADDNQAALKRRIPDLKSEKAVLDGRLREANAFRDALMQQAKDSGYRRGSNYRI